MQVGDLVYLQPKGTRCDEDYIGLLIDKKKVGGVGDSSTTLYDVLMTETNEVITVSDIYFTLWRIK